MKSTYLASGCFRFLKFECLIAIFGCAIWTRALAIDQSPPMVGVTSSDAAKANIEHLLLSHESRGCDSVPGKDRAALAACYREWFDQFEIAAKDAPLSGQLFRARETQSRLAEYFGDTRLSVEKGLEAIRVSRTVSINQDYRIRTAFQVGRRAYGLFLGTKDPVDADQCVRFYEELETEIRSSLDENDKDSVSEMAERLFHCMVTRASVYQIGKKDPLRAARTLVDAVQLHKEHFIEFQTRKPGDDRVYGVALNPVERYLSDAVLLFAEGGDLEQAEHLLKDLEALPVHEKPVVEVFMKYLRIAYEEKGGPELTTRMRRWIAEHPDDPNNGKVMNDVGRIQSNTRHYNDAIAIGEEILRVFDSKAASDPKAREYVLGATYAYLPTAYGAFGRLDDFKKCKARFLELADPNDHRVRAMRPEERAMLTKE